MNEPDEPIIVCLCGSTKHMTTFDEANRNETLKGRIVLSVGVDMKVRDKAYLDATYSKEAQEVLKDRLDCLHKRKIDKANEVLILDIDGRDKLGTSTSRELEYAQITGKKVRFWSDEQQSAK